MQHSNCIQSGTARVGIQGPKLCNCFSKELDVRGDTDDPNLLEKFKRKLVTFLATGIAAI